MLIASALFTARLTGARLRCTQREVAQGLASLGMEFSEEAVEPVTGYRVDMLLHGGGDGAAGRCAVEVGIDIIVVLVVVVIIATPSPSLSKQKQFYHFF